MFMKFVFSATRIHEDNDETTFEMEIEADNIFDVPIKALKKIKDDKRFFKSKIDNISIQKVHSKYTIRFVEG